MNRLLSLSLLSLLFVSQICLAQGATKKATDRQLTGWEAFAELTRGNLRFAQGLQPQYKGDFNRRRILLTRSRPHTVVFTCSDPRVVPEILFDQGLGDLFVVRTPGLVTDDVALASLEYALETWKIELVVVLTSEHCLSPDWRPESGASKAMLKLGLMLEERKGGKDASALGRGHQPDMVETEASRIAEWMVRNSKLLRESSQERLVLLAQGDFDLRSGKVRFARVGQPGIVDNRIRWRKSVRGGFSSKSEESLNPAK